MASMSSWPSAIPSLSRSRNLHKHRPVCAEKKKMIQAVTQYSQKTSGPLHASVSFSAKASWDFCSIKVRQNGLKSALTNRSSHTGFRGPHRKSRMELRKFVLVGLAMALAAILVAVSGKSLHSAKTLRSESEASVSVSSESSCSQSVSSDSAGDSSQSSASSDSGCHQSATTSPPGAGVTSAAGAGGEAGGAQPTQQPGGGDVTQTTGAGGEVVTQQPVTGGEAGLGASDPTTFTTNPSGQQVSTVGGRTVALSNGQLVEVDAVRTASGRQQFNSYSQLPGRDVDSGERASSS